MTLFELFALSSILMYGCKGLANEVSRKSSQKLHFSHNHHVGTYMNKREGIPLGNSPTRPKTSVFYVNKVISHAKPVSIGCYLCSYMSLTSYIHTLEHKLQKLCMLLCALSVKLCFTANTIYTFSFFAGDISKPEEIFHIIEHFCLGRRRLHLFGTDNSIRPGPVPANHLLMY